MALSARDIGRKKKILSFKSISIRIEWSEGKRGEKNATNNKNDLFIEYAMKR